MSSIRSARDFGRGFGSKQPQSMAFPRPRLIEIAPMKTSSIAAISVRAAAVQIPHISASPHSSSTHGMVMPMRLTSAPGTMR